jgi:glutathionyl-hydroquinone reductase
MLMNGKWVADWQPVQAKDEKGGFVRQTSSFRNWITPAGIESINNARGLTLHDPWGTAITVNN